jgi:hypothetical protein
MTSRVVASVALTRPSPSGASRLRNLSGEDPTRSGSNVTTPAEARVPGPATNHFTRRQRSPFRNLLEDV